MPLLHRTLRRLLLATLLLTGLPLAAQTLGATPPAMNGWTFTQWQALLVEARHRAGFHGYEYRSATFPTEGQARLATYRGLPPHVPTLAANNLVEASPTLRRALHNLALPGARTEPFAVTLRDGRPGWMVVELESRFESTLRLVPGPAFEAWAKRMVESHQLPDPEHLLADPLAREQAALWQADSAAAIAALPDGLDMNTRFGDETTPLFQAILRRDLGAVRALLARGADPNRCTPGGCPLDVMSAVLPEDGFIAWMDELLSHGAQIDAIDTRFQGSSNTLLTQLILRENEHLTDLVLARGASPDAVPGALMTPLQAAVYMRRLPLAQAMLDRGANPLNFSDRAKAPSPVMYYNVYQAAVESEDPALPAWAETVMLAAGRARSALGYRLHIEQDGRRIELPRDGALTLKAAPFKLVVRFNDDAEGELLLAASWSPAWDQGVRAGDRRYPLFHPFAASALSEPPDEGSYALHTSPACTPQVASDGLCDGGYMWLGTDAAVRKDFHEHRSDSGEYVREVRTLLALETAPEAPARPLQEFKGRTLHLVASNAIDLGSNDGIRLIAPHHLRLTLR